MANKVFASVLRQLCRLIDSPSTGELGDGELLERFATQQDENAFEVLLQRHGPMVLNLCRSVLHDAHDADDAFQATFLVLARKATSIQKRASVASWLFGVAYRTSVRAKANMVRRRLHERQTLAMSQTETMSKLERQELCSLLVEELQLLPEKYRAPLVLCYLEGKTNETAAKELNWPRGSMARCLEQARDRLRERLTHRGVALSLAALGNVWTTTQASAALPAPLLLSTLKAAALFAAGQATAGNVSAPAAALADGVLQAMWHTKLRMIVLVSLILGLAMGTLGWFTYQTLADDPTPRVTLPEDRQKIVLLWDARRPDVARRTEEPILQIRADGSATVHDPYGPGKQVVVMLSAAELQEVLRSVIHTNGFFSLDPRKVQRVIQTEKLQEGQATDATGLTTVIRVCADGREHEVRCTDLYRHAQRSAETRRLGAIDQRLEGLVHWVYAGGKAGVDTTVKLANEQLQREFSDVPPLTAGDLQTATQRTDGSATVILERRGVATDKNPYSFVYTRIDRTAQGEPKVTARAKLDARVSAKSDDDAGPTNWPLSVEPKPIGTDATVKYDYDIVYVRAPRFIKRADGKQVPTAWPEIGHPYNISAGYDLMLLRPDGTEEVLVSGGEGSVTDPYVSFDGEWVYYAYFHNPAKGAGSDIYKIHVRSKKIVRLTEQTWTPNTGVANWSTDFKTPEQGKVHLGGVYNLGPCPVPGGKVAFTSNRDAFKTPRGYPQQALQLFLMDDDGANVDKIGHLNVACALHPVILKDGRLIFSSLESQGNRNAILWGIWSIHPDGTNWGPVVSAFSTSHGAPDAFHFQSQLSDGHIVVEEYYNQNTAGFGTYYKMPAAPPDGVAAFGPARVSSDPKMKIYGGGGQTLPFGPYGMMALTRFAHGADSPALPSDPKNPKSMRVGKVTHPCGAPDNHLLTVWAAGSTPSANRGTVPYDDPVDAGIYLLKDGKPIWEPGQMLLVKNDPNYNEQWPRPLVPYKRIYGVDEPARLVHRNDGKLSPHLPEGTPFGLVGTSSMYKRETYPQGVVTKGSVTATGNPYAAFSMDAWLGMNWSQQGGDAGLYENGDIHAVRILAMEPASLPVAGRFFNHAHERLRVLGEIPVRKFNGSEQPLDPDGNPDTSFLAKIPADVAFTFQLIDKDGLILNMAQTWHQLRPGEVRNDCGGCHAHSQQPTVFKDTAAAKANYKVFDLTKVAPLLTSKKNDQSGQKWDAKDETGLRYVTGTVDVEYYRDIQPILERSCVACHTQKHAKPAGNLILDDYKMVDGGSNDNGRVGAAPASYKTLAIGNDAGAETRYIWGFQSRMSPFVWKLFGRNLSGLPDKPRPGLEAQHERYAKALVYQGSIMPPPDAVAGAYEGPEGTKIKVAPLTDEDRRIIVRWIDLGCPLDRDFDAKDPQKRGRGWMLDDQRPTLTLAHPRPGANESLTRLLIGMHDYGSGLDLESFQVIADFPIDGVKPGQNLAAKFKPKSPGVWELQLTQPLTDLPRGKLTVSVKDKQGNTSRIERTLSVAALGK